MRVYLIIYNRRLCSYNKGLFGNVPSFAVYILFLSFNIAVLPSLHYNLHYRNLQNKENVVFFAIFSQKSCLKVLRLRKKQYLCIAIKKQRVSISKTIQIYDLRVL